jgi:hypothetical protein
LAKFRQKKENTGQDRSQASVFSVFFSLLKSWRYLRKEISKISRIYTAKNQICETNPKFFVENWSNFARGNELH